MGSRALEARAKLGYVSRRHRDDVEQVADARRALAEAKIADYIEQIVASAPPLTSEQRSRLAVLLTPADAA